MDAPRETEGKSGDGGAWPYMHVQLHWKKGKRFSCPQPGCHLPNSPWPAGNNSSIPGHGEFGDVPAGDGKTVNLTLVVRVKESKSLLLRPNKISR
jgi:hypothetical protein